MLGFFIRIGKNFKNVDALKKMYCALVNSKIKYGSLVWSSKIAKLKLILEKVQKRFFLYFGN